MANVLPQKALSTVRAFHRAHFMLVGSIVFLACGIVVLLALVPTYVLVSGGYAATADSSEDVVVPFNEDRDALARAQVLTKELQPFASSTARLLPVLEEALSVRPEGVIVSNISIVRGNEGTVVLKGIAPSRDEISAYRTVLLENPRFDRVAVPISALAGSGDGSFSITITGSF